MDPWRPDDLLAIVERLGLPRPDVREPATLWVEGADGVRLRLLDWGGGGPPVLMLHGGALSARTWDYVACALRRSHRVLALDMRGHGESEWTDEYAVDAMAADAEAVVRSVAGGPVHAVGMSLGGLMAAELALRAPDLVLSLTLVDVGPGAAFEATARMRGFMGEVTGAPSAEAVVGAAMQISRLRDEARIRYRMQALLRQDPDGLWRWRRDSRRATNFREILARVNALADKAAAIPAPVLLVRGACSRPFPAPAATAFVARLPDGRLREAADAGHNVQEDNPLALLGFLQAFFAEVETKRAAPEDGPEQTPDLQMGQSTTA